MSFKFAFVSCAIILRLAEAGDYGHGAFSYSSITRGHDGHPVVVTYGHTHGHGDGHGHGNVVDYHAYPKYNYNYGVSDGHTHDQHSQQESRDGDKVYGEYSLHEADGTIRTVKYTADKGGFNAHVIRSGHAFHPETHIRPAFVQYGHQSDHSY